MAFSLTHEQREAIEARDRTLLVSAAAGAGKTSVLTSRIIASLVDAEPPLDITRLLIVTFTRAAATEMRTRISKALGDKLSELQKDLSDSSLLPLADTPDEKIQQLKGQISHLEKQLMMLGSARISTIDSFYLDLVRANFEAAGMSPAFRLVDESELSSLRREIMNRVIDHFYHTEPAFLAVAELFSDVRRETELTEKLLKLAKSFEKLPDGYEFLLQAAEKNEAAGRDPFDSDYGKIVFGNLRNMAEKGMAMLERLDAVIDADPNATEIHAKSRKAREQLQASLAEALAAITHKNLDRLQSALTLGASEQIRKADRLPLTETAIEHFKEFRTKWKATAASLIPFTATEIKEGSAEAAEILRLIYRVLTRYGAEYEAAKKERDVAEFSDVSRAAYKLLVTDDKKKTPLAESLAASFSAVYIDEYQDVDAMQDLTVQAISTPTNRFMVGDIKQSIYRFRGADPAVFKGYKRNFPTLDRTISQESALLFMSENFRCDRNIIDFVNCVSGYLFSHNAESIEYVPADALRHGKSDEGRHPDYVEPRCQVMIYHEENTAKKGGAAAYDAEDDEDAGGMDDAEARMIAAEIKRLIDHEKKADGTRIEPRDIAVLGRSKDFAAPLAKHLAALGIPASDTSRKNFFENPEVLCMYALLAVIDNPLRDIYLAATLRSPFFGFTLEELITLRGAGDRELSLYEAMREGQAEILDEGLRTRVAVFLAKLKDYREKAEALPVDKLLRYLYRDTAVLAFAGDDTSGDRQGRRQNLLRLYEYARTFEVGGFKGLYRFVRYVEDLMQNEIEMPSPEGPENAVSLFTIHQAKGLERPVCFVATTGKWFNTRDTQGRVLVEPSVGAATLLPNVGSFSRAGTFGRLALESSMKQLMREEEMRILYVALTRAKERLYITGKPRYGLSNAESQAARAVSPITDYFAVAGNSYLDWILAALAATNHENFAEVTYHTPSTLRALLREGQASEAAPDRGPEAATRVETLAAEFEKQFAFSYPYAHLSVLPAKTSVSRLSPTMLDVYDAEPTGTLDALAEIGGAETAVKRAEKKQADIERLLHTFERAPLFEDTKKEPDAAARGTATHEFLQFCDLKRAANGVENELARLIEARFLSPDAADAVRVEELQKFFESDLYKSLASAREIHRETRFNIFLPADAFTDNAALKAQLVGERLLVQGVIDLVFTDADGSLILCDYKTDRLSPYELANDTAAAKALFARHRGQLDYYKKAVEALFGRAPDRTVIYSLHAGKDFIDPLS
ncbi:MAG: UvrD-helicase domain-containing protein [Clostridia bacterium]|nr:UvrD-helicase domain-containing protein [Clostridia bacterium]